MTQPVLKEISSRGIATLTLNRPRIHNAFDDTLIAQLTEHLSELDSRNDIRAVILTGAGKSFSAGADLNWMRGMAAASEEDNRDDSLRLAKLMRTLNFLSKPTIARVNGAAYGGGVGLVACCDIAIGVEGAKFALSEVKLGLAPAVIAPYVVAAIGVRHARRLFITGEVFSASEAARLGLLHRSVPPNEFDDAVDRALHLIGKGGSTAQHECKRLALAMGDMTPEAAEHIDAANAELIARLRVSEEGQAGLTAFLDKQPPPWVTEGK
ncbi:MAG TPA: enoyl-CoA hydratase-related protein [Gammaproteobacteria bacterium]|nr:enoyl-CoA hydratase-related protein [Gammaproteobacteria bacterium]